MFRNTRRSFRGIRVLRLTSSRVRRLALGELANQSAARRGVPLCTPRARDGHKYARDNPTHPDYRTRGVRALRRSLRNLHLSRKLKHLGCRSLFDTARRGAATTGLPPSLFTAVVIGFGGRRISHSNVALSGTLGRPRGLWSGSHGYVLRASHSLAWPGPLGPLGASSG